MSVIFLSFVASCLGLEEEEEEPQAALHNNSPLSTGNNVEIMVMDEYNLLESLACT